MSSSNINQDGKPECKQPDTNFNLLHEYSQLDRARLSKLSKMKEMGYQNEKLNFLKLSIYEWDLNTTVKYYEDDKYCWKYCVHQQCTRGCKYSHTPSMILVCLNNEKRHKYVIFICEYLMSLPAHSNDSMVYSHYAVAFRGLEDYQQASLLYLTYIKLDPRNAEAHISYAYTLINNPVTQGTELDTAKNHVQKAIELKPLDPKLKGNMADILIQLEDKYDESLKYSKKATSIDKNNAGFTYLQAEAYFYTNKLLLAKKYYDRTLKLGNATGSYGYEKKVVEEKINDIDDIITAREKNDKLWTSLVNNNINTDKLKNDKKEQIKFFSKAINSGVAFSTLLNVMSRFDLSFDCFQEAIQTLNKEQVKDNTSLVHFETNVKVVASQCVSILQELHRTMINSETDSVSDEKTNVNEQSIEKSSTTSSVEHRLLNLVLKGDKSRIEMAVSTSKFLNSDFYGISPGDTSDCDNGDVVDDKTFLEWEKDSTTLNNLCNNDDLDLNKYFEASELIEIQEKRIKKELYSKIAQINKELYENQVCL